MPAYAFSENLLSLISENEDPLMSSYDLAFFLASHGYDATPKDGYVIVCDCGMTMKLTPNGSEPGLANVSTA
jgi:hypothetical protein